jgi:hypothetical protein
MTLSIAPEAARLDLEVAVDGMPAPVALAVLHRSGAPGKAHLIDDRARAYSEVDLAEAAKAAARDERGAYAVKKLGEGTLLGHPCVHLKLTRGKEFVDAWVAPGLKDAFAALKTVQEANPQVGEGGLFRALEESGHAGLPMRSTVIREGQRVVTEVTRVERKALPAARFEIPAGYREAEGGAAALGRVPAGP